MADEDDYEDSNAQDELSPRDLRRQLKEANARAKEADTLREQIARLERDGVIRDAGITLNDVQRKALQATHDGPWTPDAIKTTAQDLGFVQAPAPPVDDPSLGQIAQIAQAAAGTDSPQGGGDDEYYAQIAKARSADEVMAISRAFGKPIAQ